MVLEEQESRERVKQGGGGQTRRGEAEQRGRRTQGREDRRLVDDYKDMDTHIDRMSVCSPIPQRVVT